MIDQIYKPSINEIQSIEWTGDPFEYDLNLSRLGQGHDHFLVVNPYLEDTKIIHFIQDIPETEKCVVWKYQGDWVAKLFYEGWDINDGYDEIEIEKPRYIWNRNPDLDKLMTFVDNPFGNFDPDPWDRFYKLVWYIDPRFNPLPDKVWAVSCQPLGAEVRGIKEMGYLTPDVSVELNSHLPDLGVNIDDCCPPFWELINECAYQLDSIHNTTDEPLWVVKFTPNYRKPRTWKWLGSISPTFDIEYNPDLPKMDYELDYVIPWHDFTFEHVWMLDRKHLQNGEEDIWAFKIRVSNDIEGSKQIDYISPSLKFEYNPDLPRMNYDIDYVIPWHDLGFEHLCMLDRKHLQNGEEDIWAVKFKTSNRIKGTKILGSISPRIEVLQNPDLPLMTYNIDYVIPWHDLGFEHVWLLDRKHLQNGEEDIWAVKFKTSNKISGTKIIGSTSPKIETLQNPDLPQMDYNIDYVIPWYDLGFEHVWMLDRKHLQNGEDDIWAVKFKTSNKISGTKIIGSTSPKLTVLHNPDLPRMNYDIDYIIPWHDLGFEHVWMLDRKHLQNGEEDIWAVKLSTTSNFEGSKQIGEVSPKFQIEYNPNLPRLNYNIEYVIPWHDLKFNNVLMLDKKHYLELSEELWAVKLITTDNAVGDKVVGSISPIPVIKYNKDTAGYDFPKIDLDIQYYDFKYSCMFMLDKEYSKEYDIWAAEYSFVEKPEGIKIVGVIEPIQELVYNDDIQNLTIDIDYKIPYHDRKYVHVWYLDTEFTQGKKIWAAKLKANSQARGEKIIGYVTPEFNNLDVIFISYNEPNAEENWQRVLEKAPYAKRVNGVKGIFEAHKQAAKLALTDMFYVVDGDAWLADNFNFDFQPSLFDRDCVYVWTSINPINGLQYGYGGVKLFSKALMTKTRSWSKLDMTTTVSSKLKIMSDVSNVTKFNTDEFTTWKSAFRECVKLCYNISKYPKDQEHQQRLNEWLTVGIEKDFGEYAILGARHAVEFSKKNIKDFSILKQINDQDWLKKLFKKLNKD